jgi:hypothetical protein
VKLAYTLSKNGNAGNISPELRLQQWYGYLQDYQFRWSTFASDKLPAISAIALEMANILGFQYYAELWIENIALELAWQTRMLYKSRNLARSNMVLGCLGPLTVNK